MENGGLQVLAANDLKLLVEASVCVIVIQELFSVDAT
jgi:hypothetical protein